MNRSLWLDQEWLRWLEEQEMERGEEEDDWVPDGWEDDYH